MSRTAQPPVAAGRAEAWFTVIGVLCVVAGGLVAAVAAGAAGPDRDVAEHTAWAVAYLVLIGGVAQVGLGMAQTRLARTPPAPALLAGQLAAWNLGNAAVLAGTLAEAPPAVDVGGALLLLALAASLRVVAGSTTRRDLVWAYRAGIAVLLVSIPIGLVLAHTGGS